MLKFYSFSLSLLLLMTSIALSNEWSLIWSDEFDTPGVPDISKWSFDTEGNSWDWGNNELQNYTPADSGNAWVENGTLIIEARKEKYIAPEDNQERDYTSARLRTLNKGDWLYGKFEIRAKMPRGKGTWPAVWMLNSEENDWPHSGELDIMEAIGKEPGTIYSNVWCTETEGIFGAGGNIQIDDPFDSFHTYSMEWNKDTISFFVDTIPVTQYVNESNVKSQWPFTQKFHLLLNIAIGGDWEGTVSDTTFNNPVRMYVDYVRIYKQTTSNSLNKSSLNINKPIIKSNHIYFQIEKNPSHLSNLKLFNLSGKLIKQINLLNKDDLYYKYSPLSSGLYIAQLSTNKFNTTWTFSIN